MTEAASTNGADDSGAILLVDVVKKPEPAPEPAKIPWGLIVKGLGVAALVIGLVASIIVAPLWVVKLVHASAVEVKTETKEALVTHAKNPHPDALPREIYMEHVKQADKRSAKIEEQQQKVLDTQQDMFKAINKIGSRTHRGERRWKKALEDPGD